MANSPLELLTNGEVYKQDEIIKLISGNKIEFLFNNNLIKFEKKNEAILFLNVIRECKDFQTHFPSKEYLIWAIEEKENSLVLSIKKFFKNDKLKVYIFISISKDDKFIFLGSVMGQNFSPMNDLLAPTRMGFSIYLNNLKLSHNLWQILGWDTRKEIRINHYILPQQLLEIIRDNKWRFQLNNEVFPLFICKLESLNTHVKSLWKSGHRNLDSSKIIGKEIFKPKLDIDKLVCFGIIGENYVFLDFREFPEKDPSIWTLFGKKRKIADSIQELDIRICEEGIYFFH